MSPAVRVGAPSAPGRGTRAEAGEEEVEPPAAWRELRGRAVALAAAAEERAALARRIEGALEVRRETLRQAEALGEMRRRLDLQRARAEEAVVSRRRVDGAVERGKGRLQEQIERVLPLSRALVAAHHRVQEAKEALSEDSARLGDMQRLLGTRQQCMVGQVAALYPVRVFHDLPQHAENPPADTNGERGTLSEENRTLSGAYGHGHVPSIIKSRQVRALTFFGWQIMKPRRKQKNYSDKELQRSATVLGYAAHAVLLIASYLDVPLRYPLRFGGSRSFVSDRLPSAETASAASAEHPITNNTESELTEYPLFLECQEDDSTRASYAIYLLHKITSSHEDLITIEMSPFIGIFIFSSASITSIFILYLGFVLKFVKKGCLFISHVFYS